MAAQPISVIWKRWGIAYTTVTDEEIPIQVNADLVHYRIERYLDGQFLERRQYESLMNSSKMSWPNWTLTNSPLWTRTISMENTLPT